MVRRYFWERGDITAYPTVSTSFLQMRKEGSDPVKPLLLATAEGEKIKLLWQGESRLLLSVTDYQLDRVSGTARRGWYYVV